MNEDKVIEKLLDHDKKFNHLEKKISDFKQETLKNQEEMITILKRLDQERIFTTRWIKRIEKEVEEHEQEITKLKQSLNIA